MLANVEEKMSCRKRDRDLDSVKTILNRKNLHDSYELRKDYLKLKQTWRSEDGNRKIPI